MMPRTLAELTTILSRVKYLDWQWIAGTSGDGFYLQVSFTAPDTETGVVGQQHGGKFYVSSHAALNEIVRTAHAAVRSAVTHEADEQFMVDGRAIYHPHLALDAMLEMADRREYRR